MEKNKDKVDFDNQKFRSSDGLGVVFIIFIIYVILFIDTNKVKKSMNYGKVVAISGESNTVRVATDEGDTLTMRAKDEIIASIIDCSERSGGGNVLAQYQGIFMSSLSMPEINHVFTEQDYKHTVQFSPMD